MVGKIGNYLITKRFYKLLIQFIITMQVDQKCSLPNSLATNSAPQNQTLKSPLLDCSWNGRLPIDNGNVWKKMPLEHAVFFNLVTWKDVDLLRVAFDEPANAESETLLENQENLDRAISDFLLQKNPENIDCIHGTSALVTYYSAASKILELNEEIHDVTFHSLFPKKTSVNCVSLMRIQINKTGEHFTTNEKNEMGIKVIKLCRENPFRFHYKTSYQAEDFDYVDMNRVKMRNTRRSSRNLSVEELKEEI